MELDACAVATSEGREARLPGLEIGTHGKLIGEFLEVKFCDGATMATERPGQHETTQSVKAAKLPTRIGESLSRDPLTPAAGLSLHNIRSYQTIARIVGKKAVETTANYRCAYYNKISKVAVKTFIQVYGYQFVQCAGNVRV